MEASEEVAFKDAVSGALHTLAGVAQALWHVRDESSDYEMCHMLARVVDETRADVADAMPGTWRSEKVQG